MLKKEKQEKLEQQAVVSVEFLSIKPQKEISDFSKQVIKKCFEVENLQHNNFCVYVTLTNSAEIKKLNMLHRNIDAETDVLSFPMFDACEIEEVLKGKAFPDCMLGDIVISINKARQQSIDYGHSFERELGFLLTHGFYHLLRFRPH